MDPPPAWRTQEGVDSLAGHLDIAVVENGLEAYTQSLRGAGGML